MTTQFSVATRNARLDAIETAVGASAKLQIYSGVMPTNCAAGTGSGVKLVEMSLPSDYLANAAAGSKSMSGVWSGAGVASGNAGYFRIVDSTGATCHVQGTVTATGGSGDMTLDNTSIASAQTVNITSFVLTDGNA